MRVFVRLEAVLEAEGFRANVALELLDIVVLDLNVLHQRGGAGHLLLTDMADVSRFVLVMEMNAPLSSSAENLLTDSTFEPIFEDIDLSISWSGFQGLRRIPCAVLLMNPQLAVECESLKASGARNWSRVVVQTIKMEIQTDLCRVFSVRAMPTFKLLYLQMH